MSDSALDLPLTVMVAAVQRAEVSPSELVEEALRRIAADRGALNAVVTVDAVGARSAARAVESSIRDGRVLPLAGVPFAVKESEPVAGWRRTAGDPHRATAPPSLRDSIQVGRLRAAGAIPVGATNLALYGGWAETTNPLFGTTANPWDPARIPGGSSGGSAAAVAAGSVPFATASDGGGSIRIPAAACGVVGLKPTAGVVPLGDELPPPWGTLAVRAPITRTVADLAAVLDVVAGPHRRDPASVALPGAFATALGVDPRGLRVAWSPTLGYARPDPRIVDCCSAAAGHLAAAGALVEEVDGVLDVDPLDAFTVPFVLAIAAEVRGARGSAPADDLGATLVSWLAHAESVTVRQVEEADLARHRLTLRFAELFERCDVLVCPTLAQLPPRIPHPDAAWVQFTHPFNLTGMPALSLPVGTVSDAGVTLPVGIQLVGPRLVDQRVVGLGDWLERELALDLHPPAHVMSENR